MNLHTQEKVTAENTVGAVAFIYQHLNSFYYINAIWIISLSDLFVPQNYIALQIMTF